MKQTLQSFLIGPIVGAGATPKVRLAADSQFQSSTGEVHLGGDSQSNYTEITLTPSGDGYIFPDTIIDTNTDSPDDPNSTYSAFVMNGATEVQELFGGYSFPASAGNSISWTDLKAYNVNRVPLRDDQAYSKVQSDAKYNALLSPDARTTVAGKGYASKNPSSGAPIFVTTDDPILGGLYTFNVKSPPYNAKGDGVTDDTSAIQAAINAVATAGGGVVYFPAGVYKVAGALQDTSASNAQLVLPKVNNSASMITVGFVGESVPPTPWNQNGGSIIRSTLSSGTGAVIGVKHNQGGSEATAAAKASNISSNIFVSFEDITIRLPMNPTNSGLDVSRVRNFYERNLRIDTDDFGSGGANPHFFSGTIIPSPIATEPMTSSSFGLKMPEDYLPNNCVLDGLFLAGFYNALRVGELGKGRNIVIHCCKVGLAVEGSTWPSRFENVTIAATARPIKALGVTPDFVGLPDANATATIFLDNVGIETDSEVAWTPVVYIVDDPNNYLSGKLQVYYGHGADIPLNPSYPPGLQITRSERPWNTREPITQLLGPSSLTAVYNETKRGIAVSNDTWVAWNMLTNNQSGLSNGIGALAYLNDAIANGSDKRLFMEYVTTDGAINSGKATFYIMNGGTLSVVASFDRFLNFNLAGLLRGDEQTLSITSNTIAPTKLIVHVNTTNTLKTITVPPGSNASFTIALIPDAAWPYDNTGNIVGTGTAVVGRTMFATYTPSTGKFYMSY